jgi:Fic family protein
MDKQVFSSAFPGKLHPIKEGGVAFIPKQLPPKLEVTSQLRDADAQALLSLGELRAILPFLPNPDLLSKPFLRREALLSSRIEGSQMCLQPLLLFEAEEANRSTRNDDSEEKQDAREVLNYIRALECGLSQLDRLPVCNRLLKNIHFRLLDGVRGESKMPGQFRKIQNFIGRSPRIKDARFVPPPPDFLEKLMHGLEIYINTPQDNLPSLIQLALIHYQFEAIHPFADGNGRVGRLLISLLLSARHILSEPLLYLSAYFERKRDDYVHHLWEVSRSGAWEQWILFFLEGVRHESSDATDRAKRLLKLREEYRSLFHHRRSAALLRLLDQLFIFPVITVPEAMKTLKMTYNGTKKNLEKLVAYKILTPINLRQRTKVYFADKIFEIMDPDRDQAIP